MIQSPVLWVFKWYSAPVWVWCRAISHPITSSSPALSQLLSAPHAPTPLCSDYYSDPIKFETVPREAGAPRDRAYWRGERSFLFALVSTRTLSVPFVILLQFVGFSSTFLMPCTRSLLQRGCLGTWGKFCLHLYFGFAESLPFKLLLK